jgi:hypothetical protein
MNPVLADVLPSRMFGLRVEFAAIASDRPFSVRFASRPVNLQVEESWTTPDPQVPLIAPDDDNVAEQGAPSETTKNQLPAKAAVLQAARVGVAAMQPKRAEHAPVTDNFIENPPQIDPCAGRKNASAPLPSKGRTALSSKVIGITCL